MNRKKLARRTERARIIATRWSRNRIIDATLDQFSEDVKRQYLRSRVNPELYGLVRIDGAVTTSVDPTGHDGDQTAIGR